jgi:hypothetical protein
LENKEKSLKKNFFSRLKPLDIECMKALHHKVNIVPIIAKADALTPEELVQMKQNVCRNKFENKNLFLYLELIFRFLNKFVIIIYKFIKFLNVIQMKMKNLKNKIVN